VETTAEIDLTDEMKPFIIPADSRCRRADSTCAGPTTATTRPPLQDYKGFAAIAFARANKVNRITMIRRTRASASWLRQSYEDIRQALRELGVTPDIAARSACALQDRHAWPWSRRAYANSRSVSKRS